MHDNLSPADELRQAAQHLRAQIENRARCWMDYDFTPTVAGHIADCLEQRARPLDTIDAASQKFLVGDRDDASLDPAVALARAINAPASPSTSEEPA